MYLSNLTRPVPVIGVKVAQSTYGLSSERGVLLLMSRPIFPLILLVMIKLSMIGPIVASLGSRPIPPLLSSPLGQISNININSNIQWPQRTHLSFSKSFGVANSVFIPFTGNNKYTSTFTGNFYVLIFSISTHPYFQGSWSSPECCQWLLSV